MRLFLLFSSCWLFFFACEPSGIPYSSSKWQNVLINPATPGMVEQIKANAATCSVVEKDEKSALWISYDGTSSKPGITITAPAAAPWDLRGVHKVVAEVSNSGSAPQQVEMYVGNDPDGLVRWYCSDYIDLAPGETGKITVPLAWTPWIHEPQLGLVGMRGAPGQLKTDQAAIQSIKFNARYADGANEFLVHAVYLEDTLEVRDTTGFLPFIDVYGQYQHRNWPTKIQQNEDFTSRNQAELEDLDNFPVGPERDEYGGWVGGPKLEATGFFRTEKVNEKWWLVDPLGHLFWSTGLNCVQTGFGLTGTEGREAYFAELPALCASLAPFYDQGRWASHGFYQDKVPFDAFNYYEANLFRKFGPEWQAAYLDRIHARFKSWGMTTLGNVSDPAARSQQQTPYVGTVWILGTPKIAGATGFWGKFHDVFSPAFKQAVRASMESQRAGADDPWCIGFFVDNELSWGTLGSLSVGVLRSPAEQPAKVAMIAALRDRYANINQLNATWGTDHASWAALAQSTSPPDFASAKEDLISFHAVIADHYFKIIHEELERLAPNHLYLGCRFAWANDDVTMRAAAKYCDVISFNKYEYSVEALTLPAGIDKPTMIG
ncbi:MAG: beta-agarase, partial [Bacteroidota bacterium]